MRSDLQTTTFRKRVIELAKTFFGIYNLHDKIVAELPDYDAFDPQYRKRPKYPMVIDNE